MKEDSDGVGGGEQAFTVSLRRVQGRNCSTADSSDTLQGIVDLRIGGRLLIKDSVVTLLHGHSYALIGNNGCGKSTLLSALCHLFPTQMFLLEQQDVNNALNQSTETVLEYVCNNDQRLRRCQKQLKMIEDGESDILAEDALTLLYSEEEDLQESAKERAQSALKRVGYGPQRMQRPLAHQSCGWRMKARLAVAINSGARCLLLDEPTTSLDMAAIEMLQALVLELLEDRTLIIVSHNRAFLEATASDVLVLQDQSLKTYGMPFEAFWESVAESQKFKQKRFEKQDHREKALRKQIGELQQRTARGDASAAGALSSRKNKLEQLEDGVSNRHECGKRYHRFSNKTFFYEYGPNVQGKLEPPKLVRPPRLSLQGGNLDSFSDDAVLLSLEGTVGYDSDLQMVNIAIWKETRLGIVGKNGTGKSLVLQTLAGDVPLRAGGVRKVHPGLRIAVMSQLAGDSLPGSMTSIAHVQEKFQLSEHEARQLLGSCGLGDAAAALPISCLSGGQRARLMWAIISGQAPHVLLLDEPETHLDLLTVSQLIDLLHQWPGAIVMVTHDAYLQEVCNETLELLPPTSKK